MSASLIYALREALGGVEEEGLHARWGRFLESADGTNSSQELVDLLPGALKQAVNGAAVRKA